MAYRGDPKQLLIGMIHQVGGACSEAEQFSHVSVLSLDNFTAQKIKTLHGNSTSGKNTVIFHMIMMSYFWTPKLNHTSWDCCACKISGRWEPLLLSLHVAWDQQFFHYGWEGLGNLLGRVDSIGLKWKSNIYINISWVHSSQWISMDELSWFFWRGQY